MAEIMLIILKYVPLLIAFYFLYLFIEIFRKYLVIRKIHCVEGASFFGGHLDILTKAADESLSLSENIAIVVKHYFDPVREKDLSVLWLFWVPYIIVTNAKAAEAILSSNKVLTKATEYRYFEPWIGTGLLVSAPKKWKQRRKMLTPTFHFRILEDFLKVMNEHSFILVNIIKERKEIDLFEVIPLTTLDTICETAMGININAQRNPKSRFVNAIVFVNESIFTRFIRAQYWFDFIFYRTAFGKKYNREVNFIHSFSRDVINRRKEEILNEGYYATQKSSDQHSDDAIFYGSKKRKIAFMDLLIHNHLDSIQENGTYTFNISDICEEVDTFMFEGFETTAAAICWTLHLLGNHTEIQKKAYEEIVEIFGSDKERFVTVEDLHNLKYVECCIKEALRLYPSVPLIGRKTTEEMVVCGQTIPSGCTLLIYPLQLQKDPQYFPNADDFIPERFLESDEPRNAFAYIPFSAGPRNCIGQRFAMNEMKTIVTNVLRNFSVRSLLPTKDIIVSIEIITRTKSKLLVEFTQRK